MTRKPTRPDKPDAFAIAHALETTAATLRETDRPKVSTPRRREAKGLARQGTHQIAGHFPEATYRAVRLLAAERSETVQDLLGEALHDLLVKHGATKLLRG